MTIELSSMDLLIAFTVLLTLLIIIQDDDMWNWIEERAPTKNRFRKLLETVYQLEVLSLPTWKRRILKEQGKELVKEAEKYEPLEGDSLLFE